MAASATFALKAGVWFRRGRRFIVSPDSLGTACPLSGRNSTYRPVQILEAGSLPVFSTKVTERFKINPEPIGKDGGATQHQFSPIGENMTYTAQAAELWITDGRSLTPAAEILENAYQWWRKFIDEVSHL